MEPLSPAHHLLRRFGLGVTRGELATAKSESRSSQLERLLSPTGPDTFDVSPWRFCHDEGTEETYLDPFRTALWWSVGMLMSSRPLVQRLTLFWHDHFAVSGEKVEFGPSMLTYLQAIRTHGAGKFGHLLSAVTHTPAMARYLDMDESFRGQPNENFARELLELFTVGPGHYTEADIKETARVFTGYGVRYVLYEGGGERVQERAKDSIRKGRPLVAFAFSPELHDDSPKTIMGESRPWNGADLLERLAERPETADFVSRKLWGFFGSERKAKDETHRELVLAFTKSGGDIRTVLRAMAETDEFQKAERQLVKSPFDFVVPILRQFELMPILKSLQGPPASEITPAAKVLRDTSGLIFGTMSRMGLSPLFPPNVGGWEWGQAWISPNNMLVRVNFADLIFGVGQAEQPLAAYMGQQILARKPANEAEAVQDFLTTFDATLPESKVKLLIDAFQKTGGLESLRTPKPASESLAALGRLVFGAPEFQMF